MVRHRVVSGMRLIVTIRGRGYIVVQPFQESASLITFHVLADVSDGVVASVLRPQIQEWMLRVPETIKRCAEGPGRERSTQLARL